MCFSIKVIGSIELSPMLERRFRVYILTEFKVQPSAHLPLCNSLYVVHHDFPELGS
jgi:hypothetical protein